MRSKDNRLQQSPDRDRGLPGHAINGLRRFASEEDGTVTVLAFFIFVTMLIMGGIGLDTMRHEMARSNLQGTLDTAVLAAASANYADPTKTDEAEARVRDFMAKAGVGEYLDTFEDGDISVSNVSARIEASATNDVNTYLMKLVGVDTLNIAAASAAVEGTENIEVSLVLDISGSMRFNDRIGDLRPAARQFVTTLLGDGRDQTTSINVVPYAGQTNPGPEMFALMGGVRYGTTGADLFPESTKDISNVVLYYDENTGDGEAFDYSAKIEGYPVTDVELFNKDDLDDYIFFVDAYMRRQDIALSTSATLVGMSYKAGSGIVGPYLMNSAIGSFSPENNGNNTDAVYDFNDFYADVIPQFSSCLEIAPEDFDYTGLPDAGRYDQTGHFMKWAISQNEMDWGWCPEDDTAIVYAENDEQVLHDYLNAMRLHDGTGTHYGMKYGLALLDPDSRDEFAALSATGVVPAEFANRPLDWTAPGARKFIVLMTDGKVTEQFRPKDKYDPKNMTIELSSGDRIQTSSRSTNVSSFDAICQHAKDNDVVVYTIAFETDSTGQKEMQKCATSTSHFYKASGSNISDVFSAIAVNITQLRLIQ